MCIDCDVEVKRQCCTTLQTISRHCQIHFKRSLLRYVSNSNCNSKDEGECNVWLFQTESNAHPVTQTHTQSCFQGLQRWCFSHMGEACWGNPAVDWMTKTEMRGGGGDLEKVLEIKKKWGSEDSCARHYKSVSCDLVIRAGFVVFMSFMCS